MRARLRRWLGCAVALAILELALVNTAIAHLGGTVFVLSPRFWVEKHQAIGALTGHFVRHLYRPCDPESTRKHLQAAAKRHGVSPALVFAVARVESGMQPHRISHAGAMGVMQLWPPTARALGVSDPFDIEQSADAGARLLAQLQRQYRGDTRRVVAAYNAGPGRVSRRGELSLPGETRHYVRKVMRQLDESSARLTMND